MFTIRSSGRHHPTLCVDNLSLSNRNAARTATGRPILGHANFAPKNIEPDAQLKKEQQLGVAIHEITHALGYQPLPFLSIVIFSIYFIRVARHVAVSSSAFSRSMFFSIVNILFVCRSDGPRFSLFLVNCFLSWRWFFCVGFFSLSGIGVDSGLLFSSVRCGSINALAPIDVFFHVDIFFVFRFSSSFFSTYGFISWINATDYGPLATSNIVVPFLLFHFYHLLELFSFS